MTTPNPAAVDAEVRRMFGEVAAFLSHPELGPVLRKAATEGWDNTRLFGALQQTKFWKATGEDARRWLIISKLDPATAKAQTDQQFRAISDLARESGLTFDNAWLTKVATESLKNGWSAPQIREQLFAKAATGAKQTGALDKVVALQYGYLSAFLDEPEVGDLLRRGARNGWSPEQLEAELRKTTFWRTTTDAQRKWNALNETDPETAKQAQQGRVAEISALAQQAGVRLDPKRLEQIATDSMRYGWSQTQIKNAVTREYQYGGGTQPTAGDPLTNPQIRNRGRGPAGRAGVGANLDATPERDEFGLAGQTAREIRRMAGEYLVPISEAMLERWTEQIVRGETDMEGFNSYLVEQAKSLFPGMAGALDKGVTVAQYADPYRQIAARELEMVPESVDLNDPRFRKMLDQVDDKGNRTAMTLSQSAEYLRSMPEWQQTRGANEKAAALTENILKTFGQVV